MPRNKVGWSSKGQRVTCPRCSNDDATLIESVIYGKFTLTLLCLVCSKEWEEDEARAES